VLKFPGTPRDATLSRRRGPGGLGATRKRRERPAVTATLRSPIAQKRRSIWKLMAGRWQMVFPAFQCHCFEASFPRLCRRTRIVSLALWRWAQSVRANVRPAETRLARVPTWSRCLSPDELLEARQGMNQLFDPVVIHPDITPEIIERHRSGCLCSRSFANARHVRSPCCGPTICPPTGSPPRSRQVQTVLEVSDAQL